ncbi:MAG: hypothetical protein FWD97_04220 [Defluviitaleaceae bacterium]|nr:hypothetical protein [Defluviitaleaceae bacterium]
MRNFQSHQMIDQVTVTTSVKSDRIIIHSGNTQYSVYARNGAEVMRVINEQKKGN